MARALDRRTYFAVVPSRAFDLSLSDPAIVVLGLLACYADKDGWCDTPSSILAQRRGVTRQAIVKQLGVLLEAGLIEREHRTRDDGGTDVTAYRILYDRKRAAVAPPATSRVAPPRATSRVAGPATSEVADRATTPTTPGVAGGTSLSVQEAVTVPTEPPGVHESITQELVALYVDEHRAAFNASPADTSRMGAEVKRALAGGWPLADFGDAIRLAARDPFGAASLPKHLRAGAKARPAESDPRRALAGALSLAENRARVVAMERADVDAELRALYGDNDSLIESALTRFDEMRQRVAL